jgi:hypothetical protein
VVALWLLKFGGEVSRLPEKRMRVENDDFELEFAPGPDDIQG